MRVSNQIIRAKRLAEKELLSRPGVTGVDIGFKERGGRKTRTIAIRVLVKKKGRFDAGQAVPSSIRGFPTDVIERTFENHIDTSLYDPLVGGISTGPCRLLPGGLYVTGTLGAIVKDRDTDARMVLSNYHVLGNDPTASVGDTITQPGIVDGGSCPAGIVATLTRWSLGGSVDCAVAELSGVRNGLGEIKDVGLVTGTSPVELGEVVRKRGRTTELTSGVVDSVDLSSTTTYPVIGAITLTGQIGIAPLSGSFGEHGDSGSLVVNVRNQAVGLYYAGSTTGHGVANPIQAVLDALSVDLLVGGVVHSSIYTPWPDNIPLPSIETSGQPQHPILASPVESFRIDRRLRYKGDAPIALRLTWTLGIGEYIDFKDFFRYTIDNGTAQFTIALRHPKTSELQDWVVRFGSNYTADYQDGNWLVHAAVDLQRPLELAVAAPPEGFGAVLVLPDYGIFVDSNSNYIAVPI